MNFSEVSKDAFASIPIQLAVGAIGLLGLLPCLNGEFALKVGVNIYAIVNEGTAYDRFVLFLWVLVSGNVMLRMANCIFNRIEWRSVPTSQLGIRMERGLWSKLFYSARLDRSDYRKLKSAAIRIWVEKTGIDPADLSFSERAAASVSIESMIKTPSSKGSTLDLAWSRGMAGFLTIDLLLVLGKGLFGNSLLLALVGCIFIAFFLFMHLRSAKNTAEQLVFEEMARIASFVFQHSDAASQREPQGSSKNDLQALATS